MFRILSITTESPSRRLSIVPLLDRLRAVFLADCCSGKGASSRKGQLRAWLPAPSNQPTPPKTKHLIDKLQLEKIPFAGIAPVVGVSERELRQPKI